MRVLLQYCTKPIFCGIDAIVASLWLKNERGEMLSSHRSDHVTGVWGGLHNLCNVQRIFPHLGVQHVQLCYSFHARLDPVDLLQLGLFFVGIFRSGFLELILVDYTESKEESSSRAFRSRL